MDSATAAEDARLLGTVPEWLCFETMMKATPAEEGGARFIYVQASDESMDAQGERVLCKALRESADTFLRFGNVDLEHRTLAGVRDGTPNYLQYEIGRPVDVRFDGQRSFVKAQLYSGDTPLAANANMVWDSLTKLNPPARWYASIGGKCSRDVQTDPMTKARVPVITSVYWSNLALSRTPVNQQVSVAQTTPIGVFAKSLGAFVIAKAETLSAGYGTDSATLTGGAAVRKQSLDRKVQSYWDFSERVAAALRKGAVGMSAAAITDHATREYGLGAAEAEAWTGRFLTDLRDAISRENPA